MRWNWQQSDWPNFAYDATYLRSREDRFLKGAGMLVGVMAHLDADDRQNLSIELIAQEAVDSSAIEGEILAEYIDSYSNEKVEIDSLAGWEGRREGLANLRGNVKTVLHDLGGELMRNRVLETGEFSPEQRDAQFERLREAQEATLNLTHWHEYLKCLQRAGFRSARMISSERWAYCSQPG